MSTDRLIGHSLLYSALRVSFCAEVCQYFRSHRVMSEELLPLCRQETTTLHILSRRQTETVRCDHRGGSNRSHLTSKSMKGIDHVKTMHVDNSCVDAEMGSGKNEKNQRSSKVIGKRTPTLSSSCRVRE